MRPMRLGIRSSGVLLHPTSLPGRFGVGDLGSEALRFAERLAACGQSWWQMLPVVDPGEGASPYSAVSAFAGNPLLIGLEGLAEQGLLRREELEAPSFPADRVDFELVRRFKRERFAMAFDRLGASGGRALDEFSERNASWLGDYALFLSLREAQGGAAWTDWDEEFRSRRPEALERARRRLAQGIRFHVFLQYQFQLQWEALRKACAELGLGLIGDIPIFVSHDSADVWSLPEIFQLEKDGSPSVVAGVPPDYFSETGQLWGNPLYRWDVLRERGYDWWILRFKTAFDRFDAVRLDHFIGFHNCWEIPAGSKTAENGRWEPGPGDDLFEKARAALGPVQFIAEDLGMVTDAVRSLRDRLGFPGLQVLHFSFGADPGAPGYHPEQFPKNSVVYTGTHDNDTTQGWFNDAGAPTGNRTEREARAEQAVLLKYLGTDGREIHWDLIRHAWMSAADTAIVPMQDLLGLGSEARMNVPATVEGNWSWRLREEAFDDEIAERLARLTKEAGRWPSRRS